MNFFWIYLIGVVLMVQTSTALQCYTCASGEFGKCVDPDESALSECSISETASGLYNLVSSVFSENNRRSIARPICQKLIVTDGNVKLYERGCFLQPDHIDFCADARKTRQIVACELCETDACNRAWSYKHGKVNPLVLLLLTLITGVFKAFH